MIIETETTAVNLPNDFSVNNRSRPGQLRFGDLELLSPSADTSLPVMLPPFKVVRSDIAAKFKAGCERWIFGLRELRIYVFHFSALERLPKNDKFRKNRVEDLLLYRRVSLLQPARRQFLRTARQRFERGMSVFTLVEDDFLQAYLWLDPDPQPYWGGGVDQHIAVVKNAAYVQDAFTAPAARSKGAAQAGFACLARDAVEHSGKEHLYLAVFGTNRASLRAVENLGAVHARSYFCRTRFGFRKVWHAAAAQTGGAPDVQFDPF